MGFSNGRTISLPDRILFNLDAENPKCYSGSGTTAYDSITGTSLSLNNGVGYTSPAFTFDGADDQIKASAVIPGMDFQYTDEFTIEVMVKIKEDGPGTFFNNRGASSGGQNYRGWGMWTTSSPTRIKGAIGTYPSAHRWVSSTSTEADFDNIVLNKWCHFVYSYAGNAIEATLFLNGEDKTDYDNPDNDNTADIYDSANEALAIVYDSDNLISLGLDGYDDNAWESFCEIGFARVYNVALTPAEVRNNFAAARGRFGL
mgnify:FL=1